MGQKRVCATIRAVAFHHWPGAPDDVRYLASRHRHLLTVRCWVDVSHPDRDVEFHTLQRELRAALAGMYPSGQHGELELGARSCEHVAIDLLARLPSAAEVEVWEDDENGSVVTR